MKPILSIQYLRAIAAILVVFHHSTLGPEPKAAGLGVFEQGAFGVDIFFVISGFIMWTIAAARPTTPAAFIENRILRIVPLYWLMTFVSAFVSTEGGIGIDFGVDPLRLLKSLFFIPQWHERFPMVAPIMSVGWTLNLEMVFYLLFAAALVLSPPRRLLAVVGLLVAFALPRLALGEPVHPAINLYTNSVIVEFGLGVLLGAAYGRGFFGLLGRKHSWAPGLGLIGAGVLCVIFKEYLTQARILYFGLAALLICAGALLCETVLRAHPSRILKVLGDASYSIYLAHFMGLALAEKFTGAPVRGEFLLLLLLGQSVFATGFGCLVHLTVEKPLTKSVRWAAAKIKDGGLISLASARS